MASHFKWYPSSSEVTVPWNARYSFPSQVSIKAVDRVLKEKYHSYFHMSDLIF